MTGTTRKPLWALLLLMGALTAGCRSETHNVPAKVRGSVALDLSFEHLSGDGLPKDTVDFVGALRDALQARGVTVDEKAKAKIKGRASLMDEASKSSSVGGPMAFFFVNGAYNLGVYDAAGKEHGRVLGALDLRGLKDRALKNAMASYDATAQRIVADAAPRLADELVQKLWEAKVVTAP